MADFKAYYGVDFKSFDLNHYRNTYDSSQLVLDSTDKSNAGSDDRFSVWSTDFDTWAVAFHGYDFAYDSYTRYANVGTVEAFSEWFYNTSPDESAGEVFGATRTYLLKDISVDLNDFIDVLLTNKTSDDWNLLSQIFSGADKLKGSDFADRLYGFMGDDYIRGFKGADILYGDGGNDKVMGKSGNDKVFGGADDDNLFGGTGQDVVDGGSGVDSILAGAGDDTIRADEGNDFIRGQAGNDKMWGGTGDDTFQFRTGDQVDTIRDWEANDTIDLSFLGEVTDWTDLTTNHMTQDGTRVAIDGLNGDMLYLNNTDMGTLVEGNFIFMAPVAVA